jgi:hypothetical protein
MLKFVHIGKAILPKSGYRRRQGSADMDEITA